MKVSHTNMVAAAYITGESLRENWKSKGKWPYRTLAHLPTAHIAGVQVIPLPPCFQISTSRKGILCHSVLPWWNNVLDAKIRLRGFSVIQSQLENHHLLFCAPNFLAYSQVATCQRSLPYSQSGDRYAYGRVKTSQSDFLQVGRRRWGKNCRLRSVKNSEFSSRKPGVYLRLRDR